jgi:hypothetical protein
MLEMNETDTVKVTDKTNNENAAETTMDACDIRNVDKTDITNEKNAGNEKFEPCEMCGTGEKHELKTQTIYKAADKMLLAGAFVLGVLFSWLFYGNYPGISVPIFVIAFYALLLSYTRPLLEKEAKFGWFLSVPVLMISLTFFLHGNQILHILNLLALPMLILLQTLLITGINSYKWDSPGIIADLLYCVFGRCLYHVAKPFKFISSALRRKKERKGRTVFKVLTGLLISLPLIFVLGLLLSSADLVFGEFVKKLPVFFREINLAEFIGRSIVALIIFLLSFSYAWSLGHGEKFADFLSDVSGPKQPGEKSRWDQVTVITVTVMINVLYIAFVAVQFIYLFGRSGLPEGFTYSGYARRGFFELIAVSILNIGILACTLTYTKRCKPGMDIVLKVLNTIMICCTFIMLYSAHYRMSLYENAYGFTFLRVMTHAFMVFLLVLFIITLARVWFSRLPLLKPYIVVAVVAFMVINYINVDAIIAGNNIKRYYETNNIDVEYFRTLSNGVVADLAILAKDKDPLVSSAARDILEQRKKRLSAERSWQSFNLTDYLAKRYLERGW